MFISYGEESNLYGSSSVSVTGDAVLNHLTSHPALFFANQTGNVASLVGNSFYDVHTRLQGPGAEQNDRTLGAAPAWNTNHPLGHVVGECRDAAGVAEELIHPASVACGLNDAGRGRTPIPAHCWQFGV